MSLVKLDTDLARLLARLARAQGRSRREPWDVFVATTQPDRKVLIWHHALPVATASPAALDALAAAGYLDWQVRLRATASFELTPSGVAAGMAPSP